MHLGQEAVDKLVREHEVHNGVHIGGRTEVFAVGAAEGHVDAMVPVEHGGDTVKAEAVEPSGHVPLSLVLVALLTIPGKGQNIRLEQNQSSHKPIKIWPAQGSLVNGCL